METDSSGGESDSTDELLNMQVFSKVTRVNESDGVLGLAVFNLTNLMRSPLQRQDKPTNTTVTQAKRALKEGKRMDALVDKENKNASDNNRVLPLTMAEYTDTLNRSKSDKKRAASVAAGRLKKLNPKNIADARSTIKKSKTPNKEKKSISDVVQKEKKRKTTATSKATPTVVNNPTPPIDPNKDKNGKYKGSCKHRPLLALLKMDKTGVMHYTQKGEFLHQSCCGGCKKLITVLPASKVDKTVIYYCDDANKAFMADRDGKESEADKNELSCTVLCEACFIVETNKQGSGKRARRAAV